MGAVVEIWFESLIPFLLKDSHIVQWWPMHPTHQSHHYNWKEEIALKKNILRFMAGYFEPIDNSLRVICWMHH